ncbi:MAG TPA: rhodanese-like domain-containing protein [Spirochaetia bacterium]|nr:rhodanese-like domain-containing protein [Spirochaetia bacterium]
MHILVAALLLAALSASADARLLSSAELEQMLKAKDFFLVNVHVPYAGEIPQTDAFIPYNETVSRAAEYPKEKDAKIVVYCLTNTMAKIAVQDLLKLGFTNVSMLEGGMKGWKQAGLTLLTRNNAPGVPYPGAADKSPAGPLPQGCPCGAEN